MDKALLIGINLYPGAPLTGCVNDIGNMANLLVDQYEFHDNSIRLLADRRATTESILSELEWLVDGVSPNDRIVFHFSGHGVQVATRNWKREVDGLDEVICPFDFEWRDNKMIRDKQLYNMFKAIPPGTRFAWVNDSCHSGDLTRAISQNQETPKTIPLPLDVAWDVRIAKSRKVPCVRMSPSNKVIGVRGIMSEETGELEVGFVSGCMSTQTSADTNIGGIPCGALTWFLIKRLRSMPKDTSLQNVVKETRNDLEKAGYSQRPQAEGNRKDKPFLG